MAGEEEGAETLLLEAEGLLDEILDEEEDCFVLLLSADDVADDDDFSLMFSEDEEELLLVVTLGLTPGRIRILILLLYSLLDEEELSEIPAEELFRFDEDDDESSDLLPLLLEDEEEEWYDEELPPPGFEPDVADDNLIL